MIFFTKYANTPSLMTKELKWCELFSGTAINSCPSIPEVLECFAIWGSRLLYVTKAKKKQETEAGLVALDLSAETPVFARLLDIQKATGMESTIGCIVTSFDVYLSLIPPPPLPSQGLRVLGKSGMAHFSKVFWRCWRRPVAPPPLPSPWSRIPSIPGPSGWRHFQTSSGTRRSSCRKVCVHVEGDDDKLISRLHLHCIQNCRSTAWPSIASTAPSSCRRRSSS